MLFKSKEGNTFNTSYANEWNKSRKCDKTYTWIHHLLWMKEKYFFIGKTFLRVEKTRRITYCAPLDAQQLLFYQMIEYPLNLFVAFFRCAVLTFFLLICACICSRSDATVNGNVFSTHFLLLTEKKTTSRLECYLHSFIWCFEHIFVFESRISYPLIQYSENK